MCKSVHMVRRGQIHDATALHDLHTACFNTPWSRDFFAHVLAQPTGHVYGQFSDQEHTCCAAVVFQGVVPECDMLTLMTAPSHRGQGLAESLMSYAVADLKLLGMTTVFLDVAADNMPAYNLYHKTGFRVFSRRDKYYTRENGEFIDALVMQLSIGLSA